MQLLVTKPIPELTQEPTRKRAHVFIDGQNLYHCAKEAFNYTYPNYDVLALSKLVCEQNKWDLSKVCFYTGVPKANDDVFWNSYWAKKLSGMGRRGIKIFTRSLRYQEKIIKLGDGTSLTVTLGQEKGIDVRIALDIIRGALDNRFDVALVFSQDQDLSEVADEIKIIAVQQKRWILMASAFPVSPSTVNTRGIDKTDWIKIDRAMYDTCLDPIDYRSPL